MNFYELLMLRNGGEGGAGFSPTAAQLAAMNSGITAEILETCLKTSVGTKLTTATDIFQLDPGVYFRSGSGVPAVANIPAGIVGPFYCVITNTIAADRKKILFFPTGSSENHCFYTNTQLGSGFGDWRRYTDDMNDNKNMLKTLHASTVDHAVQFELQEDGAYILNGTASGGFSLKGTATFADVPVSLAGKTLILSGGLSASVAIRVYSNTASTTKLYEDTGSGVEIPFTADMAGYDIRIFVAKDYVCNNVTVKPMLRLAGTGAEFAPYDPTTADLKLKTAAGDAKASKGKTYWALGDSIVERQGTVGNLSEYYNAGALYGYIPRIQEVFGLDAVNKGNGGHTLVQDVASLTALDFSGVELVTIAYGTNDGKQAVPIGTADSSDQTTFAGALNAVLAKIYSDNALCKVLVLTPLQRNAQNNYGSFVPDANGNTLEDFANMAAAVAGRNATPCVDLFHTSGITAANFTTLLYDGLHPLNSGYERIWTAMRPALIQMLT